MLDAFVVIGGLLKAACVVVVARVGFNVVIKRVEVDVVMKLVEVTGAVVVLTVIDLAPGSTCPIVIAEGVVVA